MELKSTSDAPSVAGGRAAREGGVLAPAVALVSSGPGFFRLALAAVVGTYLLIVFGAVVRVTGSGLGCPDWPLCHGQWIPPLELTAIIEYVHRVIAALVSPLILAVVVAAWLGRRREPNIIVPASAIPVLLLVQIFLGRVTVLLELPPMVVLVHLGFAIIILGLLVLIAVEASRAPRRLVARTPAHVAAERRLLKLAWITTVAAFALVMLGAYVQASGASWACQGFPGCNGKALPFGENRLIDIHLAHRLLAYTVALLVGWVILQAWRTARHLPALPLAATLMGAAVVAQIAIGAIGVSTSLPPLWRGLHVAGAGAVWATVTLLLALARRAHRGVTETGTPAAGGRSEVRPQRNARDTITAYIALTKPRIILLLLVTTLGAMFVAASGPPPLPLVLATMLGGALSAGGAKALNAYIDRDIDGLMGRTTTRPIPAGLIPPRNALLFGATLGALAFVVFAAWVNLLAAWLSLFGLVFYVVVYSLWLKRATPSNIVIGGAAGAVPPLVGWAAVTNRIDLLGLYLFAIIFFWTPPHFWALSLIIRREYERARVPMLPIVRGEAETRRQIMLYTVLLVAVTLLLFGFGMMGPFYLVAALLLGVLFVWYTLRLMSEASLAAAARVFKYSMAYLALLFAAMVIDPNVRI